MIAIRDPRAREHYDTNREVIRSGVTALVRSLSLESLGVVDRVIPGTVVDGIARRRVGKELAVREADVVKYLTSLDQEQAVTMDPTAAAIVDFDKLRMLGVVGAALFPLILLIRYSGSIKEALVRALGVDGATLGQSTIGGATATPGSLPDKEELPADVKAEIEELRAIKLIERRVARNHSKQMKEAVAVILAEWHMVYPVKTTEAGPDED